MRRGSEAGSPGTADVSPQRPGPQPEHGGAVYIATFLLSPRAGRVLVTAAAAIFT